MSCAARSAGATGSGNEDTRAAPNMTGWAAVAEVEGTLPHLANMGPSDGRPRAVSRGAAIQNC